MAKSQKKAKAVTNVKSCSIKLLPKSNWNSAAAKTVEINPANAPALHQLRAMAPGAIISPAHLT
jgi:hypothetical protein